MTHANASSAPGSLVPERRSSHHDTLTSLPGREALLGRIAALPPHHTYGLLCIDIDELAALNEALGLAAGDLLIAEVAHRIAASARAQDLLVRFEGDKFALLLERENDPQSLEQTASALLQALRARYLIAGREVFVSTTIGVAQGSTLLLVHAEAALARAKETARGHWLLYSEAMARALGAHFHLETDLRRAVDEGQFEVYYQPKASCRSGAITGFEALVRWHHPQRGIVGPIEFIPALEKTGLIQQVGAWVLRTACQQLKSWDALGYSRLQMAVNVSLRQLADPDFPDFVLQTLRELEVGAGRVELELTESMLMHDADKAEQLLKRLKALGLRLSIDDFGTGYSSLSYLKRLPLDTLKVDRSFVQDITTDPDDASITRAIISMAHSLKLTVVAEGVETDAQLATLVNEKCETIQGYFISKPVPAAAATSLLASGWTIPAVLLGRPVRKRTLLLVDDEESILLALKRLLRREDYRILCAQSGAEGLELLAKNDVDVVVTDQRMPQMTGEEFLRRTKDLYPQTVRIVLSGYADMQSIANAINQGAIYKFMSKPWDDKTLKDGIREAFARKEKNDASQRQADDFASDNDKLHKNNQSLSVMLDEQSHRTRISHAALYIAQQNLHMLAVPVLGMDPHGLLVLSNEAFGAQGIRADECLALAVQFPPWPHSTPFSLVFNETGGRSWRVLGRHLSHDQQHRGTVLAFLDRGMFHD